MTPTIALSYGARLWSEALVCGLLGYLGANLGVALLAPRLLRRLEAAGLHMHHPGRRAAAIWTLRVSPLLAGLGLAGGLCVPSFLWLEPAGAAERVTVLFFALAAAGAGLAGWILLRLLRTGWQSLRFARQALESGQAVWIGASPVVIVDGASKPWLALAGILRPRLLIARRVLERLSPEQLQAGLRHERAHERARDNLKRLLVAGLPRLIAAQRMHQLERAWARLAEWHADDAAVQGDEGAGSDCPLHLASALVEVARLGACPQPAAAVSLFTRGEEGVELATRVERLLQRQANAAHEANRKRTWLLGACICAAAALILQPAMLIAVHEALEHLLR